MARDFKKSLAPLIKITTGRDFVGVRSFIIEYTTLDRLQ